MMLFLHYRRPGLSELMGRFGIAASVLRVRQEKRLRMINLVSVLRLAAELTYYDIFNLAEVTLQDCRMLKAI